MSKEHTYPEERKRASWNKAVKQAEQQQVNFHYRYFWKSMTNPPEEHIHYGLCSPNFAMHRSASRPELWRITHKPTGHSLPWFFAKQKHAKQIVIQLETLTFPVPWTSSDPEALRSNGRKTSHLIKPYLLRI